MEVTINEEDLKLAGAESLPDGRLGLRIHGWEIESSNLPILTSLQLQLWEEKLKTSHLPEMIFGNSCLNLKHVASGTKIHFNAFDALAGWKVESLPPVEVPAAAKWKFKSNPLEKAAGCTLCWKDCEERIDVTALASKEPILFYDEVVLYEDELADNGVSLLTVKVRVMPSGWFLLLRYWLRVDGVLMRLRDTRMHCVFDKNSFPIILREICWREGTFSALATKGYPVDTAAYNDPSIVCPRLPVVMLKTQRLIMDDDA